MPICGLGWIGRRRPKASFVRSKTVEFALNWFPSAVVANEPEVAIIGHDDETIAVKVFARLLAFRRLPCVIRERLYLDDSTLRDLALPGFWLAFLALLLALEAKVRVPCPLTAQLAITNDVRIEQPPDLIKENF